MPIGNMARGLANYKAGKFGLRTLFRHPLLAIAFGVGALWYRKRLAGGRGGLRGGLGGLGASLRRADPMPDRWAR